MEGGYRPGVVTECIKIVILYDESVFKVLDSYIHAYWGSLVLI